jgi:hypothetical protein
MACESELSSVGAALAGSVAACATVETGIGAVACAAALWAYYNAVDAYDQCRQQHGLAAITEHVQQVYADASAVQAHADANPEQTG